MMTASQPLTAGGQTGIAAKVGQDVIKIERLQPQVDLVLTKTPATGRQLEIIQAQILEENIKQRLVNLYLQNSRYRATEAEVDLELADLRQDLAAQDKSLEDLYQQRGINATQLRESIAWDLSWGKYLDQFLTEENLQKYYQQHRRKFDGTRLRVAHVLIKPEDPTSAESWNKAFEKCQSVAARIQKQEIDFEQAVVEYSAGATKINQGDLGWIQWNGPMAREFTIAAFELQPGEVSPPVPTSFGYHLIRILEEEPGKKSLDDVRPLLVPAVKRYLFDWLASKQAESTAVSFTCEFPHFQFGTKILGPASNTDLGERGPRP